MFIDLASTPLMPTRTSAVPAAGGHGEHSWPWPVLVVLGIVVVLAVVVVLAHLTHHEQRARGLAVRHRDNGEDATVATVADQTSRSAAADDVEDRLPPTEADSVTPFRNVPDGRSQ